MGKEKRRKKAFVIDTNVILHSSSCIDAFEEHDVVIPITVLEELDTFKKGTEEKNYNAREFIRKLRSISEKQIFNGGVSLGEGRGKIMIKLEQPAHEDIKGHFPNPSKPDHRILNIAYLYAKANPEVSVVLVSKDGNFCLKAQALGLSGEDYTKDHVKSDLREGCRLVENCDSSMIDGLFASFDGVLVDVGVFGEEPLMPNEYVIMRSGSKSALATYSASDSCLYGIKKKDVYGVMPRNAEQSFAVHALCNPAVSLVALSGKAGTGKTLLAIAAAIEQRRSYRQIKVSRPIVPLSNKDIGYLPGTVKSKVDPYMQPLYDNLSVIRNQFPDKDERALAIDKLIDNEKISIDPLTYIRGRSLYGWYWVIDEAQNLTPKEIKTAITRAGERTKVIFTGDPEQIDHPYLDRHSNGFSYMIEKMSGQEMFAHVSLTKGERSALSELASHLL
ncbi:MAG: PhoH family protein [Parcubacteria group bacterium]|jgi:PhoH-like ATPase